jgi:anti-anti-sigma factor
VTEPIAERGTFQGFALVRASGEIDMSGSNDFAEALVEVAEGTPGLIVDLSSVTYLDSAGVRAIFEVVRRLATRRQVVGVVIADSSPVRTLIKVTNMHEVIPVCDSADACAAALRHAAGFGAE